MLFRSQALRLERAHHLGRGVLASRDLANICVYLGVHGGQRVLRRLRRVAIKEVRYLSVRQEDVGSPGSEETWTKWRGWSAAWLDGEEKDDPCRAVIRCSCRHCRSAACHQCDRA